MMTRTVMTAVWLLACTGLAIAQSECYISGDIEAEPNLAQPELGAWKYTLVATWDTGTPYALSHMNLLLGAEDRCTCEDLEPALDWESPAGESDADDGGTVPFLMNFECNGDPSMGITEPLYKFEYVEDEELGEPGNTGTLTIVFYSDFAPASIATPNLFLVDKHANLACEGQVDGVFPGLPCDPLTDEVLEWGTVKAVFER